MVGDDSCNLIFLALRTDPPKILAIQMTVAPTATDATYLRNVLISKGFVTVSKFHLVLVIGARMSHSIPNRKD